MLETIGAYDAKTKLPEILRRVAAGEPFTITNRGKSMADIVPHGTQRHIRTQTAINNILSAKKPTVSDAILHSLQQACLLYTSPSPRD